MDRDSSSSGQEHRSAGGHDLRPIGRHILKEQQDNPDIQWQETIARVVERVISEHDRLQSIDDLRCAVARLLDEEEPQENQQSWASEQVEECLNALKVRLYDSSAKQAGLQKLSEMQKITFIDEKLLDFSFFHTVSKLITTIIILQKTLGIVKSNPETAQNLTQLPNMNMSNMRKNPQRGKRNTSAYLNNTSSPLLGGGKIGLMEQNKSSLAAPSSQFFPSSSISSHLTNQKFMPTNESEKKVFVRLNPLNVSTQQFQLFNQNFPRLEVKIGINQCLSYLIEYLNRKWLSHASKQVGGQLIVQLYHDSEKWVGGFKGTERPKLNEQLMIEDIYSVVEYPKDCVVHLLYDIVREEQQMEWIEQPSQYSVGRNFQSNQNYGSTTPMRQCHGSIDAVISGEEHEPLQPFFSQDSDFRFMNYFENPNLLNEDNEDEDEDYDANEEEEEDEDEEEEEDDDDDDEEEDDEEEDGDDDEEEDEDVVEEEQNIQIEKNGIKQKQNGNSGVKGNNKQQLINKKQEQRMSMIDYEFGSYLKNQQNHENLSSKNNNNQWDSSLQQFNDKKVQQDGGQNLLKRQKRQGAQIKKKGGNIQKPQRGLLRQEMINSRNLLNNSNNLGYVSNLNSLHNFGPFDQGGFSDLFGQQSQFGNLQDFAQQQQQIIPQQPSQQQSQIRMENSYLLQPQYQDNQQNVNVSSHSSSKGSDNTMGMMGMGNFNNMKSNSVFDGFMDFQNLSQNHLNLTPQNNHPNINILGISPNNKIINQNSSHHHNLLSSNTPNLQNNNINCTAQNNGNANNMFSASNIGSGFKKLQDDGNEQNNKNKGENGSQNSEQKDRKKAKNDEKWKEKSKKNMQQQRRSSSVSSENEKVLSLVKTNNNPYKEVDTFKQMREKVVNDKEEKQETSVDEKKQQKQSKEKILEEGVNKNASSNEMNSDQNNLQSKNCGPSSSSLNQGYKLSTPVKNYNQQAESFSFNEQSQLNPNLSKELMNFNNSPAQFKSNHLLSFLNQDSNSIFHNNSNLNMNSLNPLYNIPMNSYNYNQNSFQAPAPALSQREGNFKQTPKANKSSSKKKQPQQEIRQPQSQESRVQFQSTESRQQQQLHEDLLGSNHLHSNRDFMGLMSQMHSFNIFSNSRPFFFDYFNLNNNNTSTSKNQLNNNNSLNFKGNQGNYEFNEVSSTEHKKKENDKEEQIEKQSQQQQHLLGENNQNASYLKQNEVGESNIISDKIIEEEDINKKTNNNNINISQEKNNSPITSESKQKIKFEEEEASKGKSLSSKDKINGSKNSAPIIIQKQPSLQMIFQTQNSQNNNQSNSNISFGGGALSKEAFDNNKSIEQIIKVGKPLIRSNNNTTNNDINTNNGNNLQSKEISKASAQYSREGFSNAEASKDSNYKFLKFDNAFTKYYNENLSKQASLQNTQIAPDDTDASGKFPDSLKIDNLEKKESENNNNDIIEDKKENEDIQKSSQSQLQQQIGSTSSGGLIQNQQQQTLIVNKRNDLLYVESLVQQMNKSNLSDQKSGEIISQEQLKRTTGPIKSVQVVRKMILPQKSENTQPPATEKSSQNDAVIKN